LLIKCKQVISKLFSESEPDIISVKSQDVVNRLNGDSID